METPKTTTPTATIGKQEIPIWEVGKKAAEDFVRKLELSGKAETRTPGWPIMRAGFLTGHATGFDLGIKLGQKLATLPGKESEDESDAQLELPL